MTSSNSSRFLHGVLLLAAAAAVNADEVTSKASMGADVSTENVHQDGSVLRGVVVNHSAHRIEGVQLGITYHWLWTNEFRPGTGNPGWAVQLALPDSIAPGESLAFSYAPAQSTTDTALGSFHPEATVTRYTRFVEAVQPLSDRVSP